MKTPIFILLFLFRIQVSAQPLTSDIKKEIITQINEFRKVTGDNPRKTLKITRNSNLDKAAQFHSDWLANSGLATIFIHLTTPRLRSVRRSMIARKATSPANCCSFSSYPPLTNAPLITYSFS